MVSTGRDIAIVGAGVAGLSAATLLTRAGHRVTVFERFDTSLPLGSGLMLQPTGLAVMERLGLRAEIERRGHRIDRLHGITDRQRIVFDVAYADLDPMLYAVAVHRGALHGVLWQAFAASGAALETGANVKATEELAGGKAMVVFDKGQKQGPFDLVVDASGANSPLRAQVTGSRPRPFRYGAVWATMPDIGVAPARLAQRYVAAEIMLGYLPIGTVDGEGPPLTALFWSLKTAEHQAWRTGFGAWRDQAARLWPELEPGLATLSGPDLFTLAGYSHFTASRFHRGPVVLIGDAAHSTSPQLGQGANQGLLDAAALTDSLAAERDLGAALVLFEQNRRNHVRFYQVASALLTGFFQSDSRMLAWLRDQSFHRLKSVPYLRREMVRTLAGLKTGLFTSGRPEAIAAPLGRRKA
jgi:2-polyprenyl-6-methoxyphenol hydroxylase-like FAD-dependent oxidoreductase